MDGQKTQNIYESIYSINKDYDKDKNYESGIMKNQPTVGDTDGNISDVTMYDLGITTYLEWTILFITMPNILNLIQRNKRKLESLKIYQI